MVEYGVAIGYGIIVEREQINQIFEKIENNFELCDEFRERWLLEFDSWTGSDYFLGAIRFLGSDVWAYNVDEKLIDNRYIGEFLNFIKIAGLSDFISNDFKLYIIHYCH